MATKKKPSAKPKAKPATVSRLQNLAARPPIDDVLDEQLVDHSGVFRVTTELAMAQSGHGEESTRFPSDSLVMAAQRDGFRDEGPTLDEDLLLEVDTATAEKKQRLATLTALARSRSSRTRR